MIRCVPVPPALPTRCPESKASIVHPTCASPVFTLSEYAILAKHPEVYAKRLTAPQIEELIHISVHGGNRFPSEHTIGIYARLQGRQDRPWSPVVRPPLICDMGRRYGLTALGKKVVAVFFVHLPRTQVAS